MKTRYELRNRFELQDGTRSFVEPVAGQATMKTELRGHLDDIGDGFAAIMSWHDDAYVLAVAVPRNAMPAETLQLIKPGTRCRLVLETDNNERTP